ncbi:conjugal transfer protein TraN, partial [Alcanivorax sp.]|uniref:conjugal transfer protein TraN n=1 Tax=Alcanivorax sp. TaxID=1872427 RepID=UPI002582A113
LGGSIRASSHPNLSNDPFFFATKNALGKVFTNKFSGCTSVTIPNGGTSKHVPVIQHCTKPRTTVATCRINHPKAYLLPSYKQCDHTKFKTKTVAFGWPNYTTFKISCSASDKLVVKEYYNYPGWWHWLKTYGNCDPQSGSCVQTNASMWSGWSNMAGVGFSQSDAGGKSTYTFTFMKKTYGSRCKWSSACECTRCRRIVTGSKSIGTKTVVVKRIADAPWSPSSCITLAKGIDAGTIHGSYSCTMNYAGGKKCYSVGGATVCPSDLGAAPINVPNTCGTVTVSYYAPKTTDTCGKYEKDPNCSYVSSKAIPGSEFTPGGPPGAYDVTYDCGYNVTVPSASALKVQCPGAVSCAGGSCVTHTPETNPNFGKAASYLQSAQTLQSDGKCDPVTGNCTVFPGQDKFCKHYTPFKGINKNCCTKTVPTPDLGSYIDLVLQMNSLDNAIMTINSASGTFGSWAAMHNAVSSTWSSFGNTVSSAFDKIVQPISNAWESIVGTAGQKGGASLGKAAAKGLMNKMTAALTQKVASFVLRTFGKSACNMLFQAAGGGPASAALAKGGQVVLNPAISAALGWVMLAYTIYQLTVIIINLIFKCKKPDFEFLMKKKLRVCHVVGSACTHTICLLPTPLGCAWRYCTRTDTHACCFNSPLSRIIQEQVRPQLGIGWGSPLAPNCSGLKLSDLQRVNWSRVDLSEWEAILKMTGHWPSNGTLNTTKMTGAGSKFDVGAQSPAIGTRLDLKARTQNKLRQKNTNKVRQSLQQGMWSLVPQ